LYPDAGLSARQLAKEIRKEHRHAVGSWYDPGVAVRQHGSLKGWVRKILSGAYEVRSRKDASKVFRHDPSHEGIIQFNFDTAFDNLDTSYRSALELAGDVLLKEM